MNDEIELFDGEEGEVIEDHPAEVRIAVRTPQELEDEVALIEKRAELTKRIVAAALSMTNVNDWVDMGGKPYLQGSGAEKIARRFQISWDEPDREIEHYDDGHYDVRFVGSFYFRDDSIIAMGAASSRDGFFSKSGSQVIDPGKISKNNVIKKAFTNYLANGITRILGIRNLTWEQVEAATGVKRQAASQVRYKETDEVLEKKRTDLWDMLLSMAGEDQAKAGAMLAKCTVWTDKETGEIKPGKTDPTKLTVKQIPYVYKTVEANFKKWEAKKRGVSE